MLQQTGVPRVIPKYHEFLATFPDVYTLANADLGEVLRVWQGLGYNRRAKFLWQAARQIAKTGVFPRTCDELVALSGIGKNTAGAILVYAFDQPVGFVETNIRTVFIHHFFADRTDIHDSDILKLVSLTLPVVREEKGKEQPETRIYSTPGALRKTVGLSQARLWYWALMDYGSYLKKHVGNLNTASKHYTKQSPFHGSLRQVRGAVLRHLAQKPHSAEELMIHIEDERLLKVLDDLAREGLIRSKGGVYLL